MFEACERLDGRGAVCDLQPGRSLLELGLLDVAGGRGDSEKQRLHLADDDLVLGLLDACPRSFLSTPSGYVSVSEGLSKANHEKRDQRSA